MCGIAGFLGERTLADPSKTIARMTATLRHRGPDDQGTHVDRGLALGVRRLAVIDLATGHQPVSNEDGTVWVVQNGEIYNFAALREELLRLGHVFRTRSDTEVIVHAYEQYGRDCVSHLDGMFAFAVWDAGRSFLLLARDRMGEKPLYYHAGPDAFVFGSELRAILAHPAVPRQLDLASVRRFFGFEYVPAPHSIMTGISKLPPGHVLTVTAGRPPRVAPYWDLAFAADRSTTEREWNEAVLAQLRASVERQLVSDVPLGMLLSGGIDSSAIVAMATRALAGRRLKTFSIGFAEESYDERPFARTVADLCGTDHTAVEFTAKDALALLDDAGDLLDEPLGDGTFLPLYRLAQTARRSVTVVLSGDGGDELFCGYPTFQVDTLARWMLRLPAVVRRAMTDAVNRLRPSPRYGSFESLLKRFFRALPYPPEVRTQRLLGGLAAAEQSALLAAGARAIGGDVDPYEELVADLSGLSAMAPLDRLIYQHCKRYLADQNLVTVDRATMACGLEVRAPFLDRPLVELACRIPPALKLRGWRTKYVLKQALRGVLPDAILDRRKQGFMAPFGAWMRGPLRHVLETRLSADQVTRVGLFDAATVTGLVTEHVGGLRDHQRLLWALLMFDAWRERYLPGVRWTE